eukprot:4903290-Lingulodinium_polyedra.AAC.1
MCIRDRAWLGAKTLQTRRASTGSGGICGRQPRSSRGSRSLGARWQEPTCGAFPGGACNWRARAVQEPSG